MREWIRKWRKLLVLALVLAGFFLYPPVILSEIRVDFEKEDYTGGDHLKVLASFSEFAGADSVKTTYEKPGEARVFFWDLRYRNGRTLKRIDPVDYNLDGELRIQGLTFFINGFYAGSLEGEALLEAFSPNEQVEMYETEAGSLGLLIKGEDSQLIPTEAFCEYYKEMAGRYARTGIFYLLPLLAVLWFAAEFYRRRIWEKREGRFFLLFDTLFYAAGVLALVLIFIGVFTGSSEINPDESESIYSVRYYLSHFMPPDARKLDLKAYSVFGTARLTELNLFYLLAAQIARFFTFEHAARFFSFLMIAGLMYLVFFNLKKNRYLLCALFLTPQLWYLYTYCTSDALDFAVGVLVLYQLAARDSMLQKLVKKGVERKDAGRVLLLGFLFANIFFSKQNYYVFAVYAFCMLMAELCCAPKEERKRRFVSYLWIAAAALLFLGLRYIPEFWHYGTQRHQVLLELQKKIAIPKLNPASPPSEQSSAFNLFGKGVTLRELLFRRGLHKTMFRSFVGTYGSLQFPSPDWYCLVMGILYLVLLLMICVPVLRERGHKERKIKLGLLFFSGFVSYALVIYNAWFIDFQAQGRYMLPVLIFAAHGAALKPELAKSRTFQVILGLTALLSLYSFGVYAVPNIKPPY